MHSLQQAASSFINLCRQASYTKHKDENPETLWHVRYLTLRKLQFYHLNKPLFDYTTNIRRATDDVAVFFTNVYLKNSNCLHHFSRPGKAA